ncbi:protein adenylyltransferase SelO [Dongshaea marina]
MSSQTLRHSIDQLSVSSRFVEELSADPLTSNEPRQVYSSHFSLVEPRQFRQPEMVSYFPEVAQLIGLSEKACQSDEFVRLFSGQSLLPGMRPHAHCYGGHQFGSWAGQLGDGRAINLGEVRGAQGVPWQLQLKGAGPTPYSRSADGYAVLRSSLREYLCSEAMHNLGVPTTRALSLILTGEQVVRDILYDGHPRPEPGAVVCRVAPSFLRLGHFEIFTARDDTLSLRQLADYSIRHHFPDLGTPGPEAYSALFETVCRRTAELMVEWQRVGFVHGVMNTDNLSLLGMTIDYGPYGWMEAYDPDWTPNTTDAGSRRYAYGNQPGVALWNLVRFAESLLPLVGEAAPLEQALQDYQRSYIQKEQQMKGRKLGLESVDPQSDAQLIGQLEELMQDCRADMTLFFRSLSGIRACSRPQEQDRLEAFNLVANSLYDSEQLKPATREALTDWLGRYQQRLSQQARSDQARAGKMNRVNPVYVLRNALVQLAIEDAERGEYQKIYELQRMLKSPYEERSEFAHLAQKSPEWAKEKIGCSMLSCSS